MSNECKTKRIVFLFFSYQDLSIWVFLIFKLLKNPTYGEPLNLLTCADSSTNITFFWWGNPIDRLPYPCYVHHNALCIRVAKGRPFFNRPGVAGAVSQSAPGLIGVSLWNILICFFSQLLNICFILKLNLNILNESSMISKEMKSLLNGIVPNINFKNMVLITLSFIC